jgi:hypothetical protein
LAGLRAHRGGNGFGWNGKILLLSIGTDPKMQNVFTSQIRPDNEIISLYFIKYFDEIKTKRKKEQNINLIKSLYFVDYFDRRAIRGPGLGWVRAKTLFS